MADFKARNVDDAVAAALEARARARGVSPEEEMRQTLPPSVAPGCAELVARAKALHAAAGKPELDSARTIREDRNAWG